MGLASTKLGAYVPVTEPPGARIHPLPSAPASRIRPMTKGDAKHVFVS